MRPRNLAASLGVAIAMRRTPGIIPPGKAGLFMLAAVLVPVVIKHAKPLVKKVGEGLQWLGEAVERVADSSQIDSDGKPNNEPVQDMSVDPEEVVEAEAPVEEAEATEPEAPKPKAKSASKKSSSKPKPKK